ncbi:MAG: hypothetical protein GEU74_05320 [Nitriliruptorales bacterium]|nr:hypothetical protein [Nitriliruptorales bacterium]
MHRHEKGTNVYRDDTCAVCGESLPPDHFYCREHGASVDDRLHEIGNLVPRVTTELSRLAMLLDQVAGETWDYLAEQQSDDPEWPPASAVALRADADDIEVDVDSEPGFVTVRVALPLSDLLAEVARDLQRPEWQKVGQATAAVHGANATH